MRTKVIVAGGRHFDNSSLLEETLDKLLVNLDRVEIVSGGCTGADYLGEDYAQKRGYDVTVFQADWETYRKSAGPIRNREMCQYADCLVAFWDGKSKGTANVIEEANNLGLKVRVIRY